MSSVDPELLVEFRTFTERRQSTGGSPMGETAISRGLRRTAAVPLLRRRPFLIGRLVEMHSRAEGRIPGVVSSISVVHLRLGRRFALTPGAQMLMAPDPWAWLCSD